MGDQMILLLGSLGLIGLGIFFIVGRNGMNPPSDALRVKATIVGFRTETSSSNDEGRGTTETTSTYPVYEYEVNGKTYQTRGPVGITVFSKDKYRVGNTEYISVNRDHHNRIYTEGGAKGSANMGILLIIFGVFLFFFMFLM